jgi:diaminopimelate decarboxylase
MASGKALEGYRAASQMKNVEIVGVHSHIGSQILDTRPFEEAVEKIMGLVGQIKEELGIVLELIDLGGGLGIPYKPGEKELSPEQFASKVVGAFRKAVEAHELGEPTLVLEPGRYLVADAGIILGRVGYVKERQGDPTWVAIDAGMNALVRPAMYDAYHHIEAANKMRDEHTELVNVAGPLCESGDFLGKKRHLPKLDRGDLLAVFDTGAYGLSMSSQHTAKPRPAMVLVNSDKVEVVRTRESCDDLTCLDQVPAWLK